MLLGNWLLPAVEGTPPGMTRAVGTCTGVVYVLRPAPSATAAEHERVRAVQTAAGCDALTAVGVVYDAAHWCPLCVDAAAAAELDDADGRLVELHGATVVRVDEERALVTAARVVVLAPDAQPRPRDLCSVEGAVRQRCVEAAARWGAQPDAARLLAAPFEPVAWPDDCVPDATQQQQLDAQLQHRTAPPLCAESQPQLAAKPEPQPAPAPAAPEPSPKPEPRPAPTPPKPAKRPHQQTPPKEKKPKPRKSRPMVMAPLSWLQPVNKQQQ